MNADAAIRRSNEQIDNGELREAAELIETTLTRLPGEKQSLLYCLLCIASIAEDKASVLAVFQRSRDAGVWWSPDLIRRDDDFRWLLADLDFEAELGLLQTTADRFQQDGRAIALDRVHGARDRWLISLHKRNNSNERMQRYFEESNARLGRRTRYVQSSQVTSSDGYSWNDGTTALRDVEQLTRDLAGSDPIVCGTSQGGDIAFRHALAQGHDYLGVMPAISDESIAKLVLPPEGRAVILVGEHDPCRANVLRLRDRLVVLEASVDVISLGPVGHWLPDDFGTFYERALASFD